MQNSKYNSQIKGVPKGREKKNTKEIKQVVMNLSALKKDEETQIGATPQSIKQDKDTLDL